MWFYSMSYPEKMMVLFLLSMAAGVAMAEGFPESHVKKQLELAEKGVVVDVSKLLKGQLAVVEYVDRGVYVYRRTKADIAEIQKTPASNFADGVGRNFRASVLAAYGFSSDAVWARLLNTGQPVANSFPFRSIEKDYLVVANWSPETGCVLSFLNESSRPRPNVVFRDPCSQALFDAAGRIYVGEISVAGRKRSARYDLGVPPHRFSGGNRLIIGLDMSKPLSNLNFSIEELYRDKEPTKLLIASAGYNDLETVRFALKSGAKVNYFALGVSAPIDAAVAGGSIEIVRLLVNNGARLTDHTSSLAKGLNRTDVIKLFKLGDL